MNDDRSPHDVLQFAHIGFADTATSQSLLLDSLASENAEDRVFGDYELLEHIGSGGMGVVFRARQVSLGREVAIKFIVGDLADHPQAVARFLDEARAAALMHHPHIVPVFEVGTVEGLHFFSMPLLRGPSLHARIAAKNFSIVDIVDLLIQMCGAVAYAHSLGLLHLDLKPSNVLFDEHAQAMIADFGLARQVDANGGVDVEGASGTARYMAPEQIGAGPYRLTSRTDIYALGVIGREMLDADPAPQMRTSIYRDMRAISAKCLRENPDDRYSCAAELLGDLQRCRAGDDVSARTPSFFERLARSGRRHPVMASTSVVAFVTLLAGFAAVTSQWQRAERALADADYQRSLTTTQSNRTQQLAGLMAAAFPDSEDNTSSSARHAVTWLKQNVANDPSAQRDLLGAFRQSLANAGKSAVVAPLLDEIVDQLGDGFRRSEARRLAQMQDRDSLIAATLIGIRRAARDESGVDNTEIARRLVDSYPNDALALYAAALACNAQPQPCAHEEYYQALVAKFPENAVHWLITPHGAQLADGEIADEVIHASHAETFDDHLGPLVAIVRSAQIDISPPASLLLPLESVISDEQAAPYLRRNSLNAVPLPVYINVIRVCKLDSEAMKQNSALHDACGSLAERAMHGTNASIIAKMVSSAIVRRLYKNTPQEIEAKEFRRQYVWMDEHAATGPAFMDALQNDIIQFGEWEAYRRATTRAGFSPEPPPGWLPKNPQTLLLSEERSPRRD